MSAVIWPMLRRDDTVDEKKNESIQSKIGNTDVRAINVILIISTGYI